MERKERGQQTMEVINQALLFTITTQIEVDLRDGEDPHLMLEALTEVVEKGQEYGESGISKVELLNTDEGGQGRH